MQQNQNEVEKLLVEVRKSYRLLYQYQRRVLDLVDYIGKRFGFSYAGGYSKFSNVTPREGKGNLTNWAWDWLNMYYYEFRFRTKQVNNGHLDFSIAILSDTGFFMARESNDKIDPTMVSKFADVDNSETHLVLIVGKNIWDFFWGDWNNQTFTMKKSDFKDFDGDKVMLFKHYKLKDFFNEESANQQLLDFERFCLEKGVEFKLVENKIER